MRGARTNLRYHCVFVGGTRYLLKRVTSWRSKPSEAFQGSRFKTKNPRGKTIDAFDLALPAPQLRGCPVLYAQHRISLGLSF